MAEDKQKPVFWPALLSDAPQVLSSDNLINPTMVTVSVKIEDGGTVDFTIPRFLICGHSSYFQKAFLSGFAEADKKALTIDAPFWVLQTFVRWLYTQRLYLQPTQQGGVPLSGGNKRKRTEDAFDDSMQADKKRTKTQQEHLIEPLQAIRVSNSAAQPVNGSEPANVVTFYGYELAEPSSDGSLPEDAPNHPDERDPSNPVTWPYVWLIELYHFADSYDTFAFRKLVLEFIQLKTQIVVPRNYLPPTKEDTIYAVSKLPRSDSLFKYLAKMWATDVSIYTNCDDAYDTANLVEEFPSQFLAACFLQAKRHARALDCPGCERCDKDDHVAEDRNGLFQQKPCLFHEHVSGSDQEVCTNKWASIHKNWCLLDNDAQKKEQEDDDD